MNLSRSSDRALFAQRTPLESRGDAKPTRIRHTVQFPRRRITPDDLHRSGVPEIRTEIDELDAVRLHAVADGLRNARFNFDVVLLVAEGPEPRRVGRVLR